MNILPSIRTAGSALKQYFTDPASLQQIGKAIGTEAVLGTAAQQVVPRVVGQRPSQSVPQSLMQTGIHSAVNVPVSGALKAMGVPNLAASTTGSILGSVAASRFTPKIDPEIVQEQHPDFHHLYAAQQMEAANAQAAHQMKINEIMARNYNPPSFVYHHSTKDPASTANEMVRNILR